MAPEIVFADLALARRLERTEGAACLGFAKARRALVPDCGAEWMEHDGVVAVFDGVESPITQTFGLGMESPVTAELLDALEEYFTARGAAVMHEVSPLAGVEALDALCRRGYRPIELSSVMVRPLAGLEAMAVPNVRMVGPEEAEVWAEIGARGWATEMPELFDFMLETGRIFARRERSPCFLAEHEGVPGAAGGLSIQGGVALMAGASTVPELRRRGLQGALLAARLQFAAAQGCDLAMMVAAAGSESQRNAQRKGFQIAYTRTKWQLISAGGRA